jgi:hypothetical protein
VTAPIATPASMDKATVVSALTVILPVINV